MGQMVVTLDTYQENARFAHLDGYRGGMRFSTSYATGGDTLTPQQFGFGSKIDFVICPAILLGIGVAMIIDPSNGTYFVKAFAGGGIGAPMEEYAAGTNLNTVGSFRFWAAGI